MTNAKLAEVVADNKDRSIFNGFDDYGSPQAFPNIRTVVAASTGQSAADIQKKFLKFLPVDRRYFRH